jgi:hypothetical protein
MTVSIPATDAQSTQLNGVITALTAQITAAGSNGPLVFKLTKDKANAQMNLVLHLLGTGRLLASSILTNETYTAGQDGGDQH